MSFPTAQAWSIGMRTGRVVLFQPVVSQSSFQSDGELAGKTHLGALSKIKITGIQPCRDFDLIGLSGLGNMDFSSSQTILMGSHIWEPLFIALKDDFKVFFFYDFSFFFSI